MMITLEIVDIDMEFRPVIYYVCWNEWNANFEERDMNNNSTIDGLIGFPGNECLYAKRPDGSWYKLVGFWMLPKTIDQQLYELIQSGFEPYQAFEIVAL